MLEPWRSRYLQAMGVDVYLPRYVLAAAAPAPIPVWDQSVDAPSQQGIEDAVVFDAAAQHFSPKGNPTIKPEIAIPALEPATRTVSQPTHSATRKTAAVAPASRIRLMVAVAKSGILIVDELPAPSKLQADTLRLLSNLLFAIGLRETDLQHESFEWPLPQLRNAPIERDEHAGRETLAGFLAKKIHNQAIHTVLLLGEASQSWVDQTRRDSFQHDLSPQENSRPERALTWVSSVSAQQVLRDASLKRRWWQDLHSLEPKR